MSKNSSTTEMVDRHIPSSFPLGLRVLLVDDNPTCLEIMRKKLQEECKYEVTPCSAAKDALSLLVEKKDGFDIVLTDFRMPDMDGLQLLESIRLMEMTSDLPVVLFSSEQDVDAVTRGVEKGACDFLIKPIQDDTLRMIWQHVLRVKLGKVGSVINNGVSEVNNQQERSESAINSSSDDATTHPSQGDEVNANKATAKKPRVKWTPELQKKFDIAVDTVYKRKNKDKRFRKDGSEEDRVVPKEILMEMERMGEMGLTRQHISSFLQKYRLSRRKQGESSQKQSTYPNPRQTGSGQYYYLPTESNFPASNARPAAHHHLCTRNSPVNYMPDNYYYHHPRIGQQVNPLPVATMTQQIVLPQNRQPTGLPIWSMGPHQPMSIPATTQLRPPSAFRDQYQPMSIPATTQLRPPSAFGGQNQAMSTPVTTQLRPPSAFGEQNQAMPIPATTELGHPSPFRNQDQPMSIPATAQLRPPSAFGDQNQPMSTPVPHLVNQTDFSLATNQDQFVEASRFLSTNQVPTVSNCLQGPAEWSANINTAAHVIGQNFSNNYGTHDVLPNITKAELDYPSHYPQSSLSNQVSIHPNATAASNEHASFSLQNSASNTTQDELADLGLLDLDGLDFSWLDN